jgi:hypothetical protein
MAESVRHRRDIVKENNPMTIVAERAEDKFCGQYFCAVMAWIVGLNPTMTPETFG